VLRGTQIQTVGRPPMMEPNKGEKASSGIAMSETAKETPQDGMAGRPMWSANPHRAAPAPESGCHEQNRLAPLCRSACSERLFLPSPH
jgi:hypothetical protein